MARKSAPPARPSLSSQVLHVIASRGLKPAELARIAGVDPAVIHRFISGEREVRTGTLDRIAAALGLRVVEDAPAPRGPRARGPSREK